MKKLFTLVLALAGLTGTAKAASTIDDVAVCRHSYVLVADDWTNGGTERPGKGNLFGDGRFLDVTGGSISTSKGKCNPAEMNKDEAGNPTEEYRYGKEFAEKYGEYGEHYNSLRIKNAQDVIAMKVTAGSKIIFLMQGNNTKGKNARIPKIASDEKLEKALNDAPGEDHPAVSAGFKYEWTASDDMTIYIGSYNGDAFIGMIIVEAKEAPGTPTVKVGPQTYKDGLWFKEVTCKPNDCVEEGSTEAIPTVVTYTTDGSTPTAESTKYTEPIKCYKDMTVKFQAFMDFGGGAIDGDYIVSGADNEANINFSFNAPVITAEGGNVTITSDYDGAENYYSYGDVADTKGSSFTLSESATVTAYSQIVNGSYQTFTTKKTSKDVYVLNPIKEKKTISVSGTAVVDEEATATSTTGTIYKIEDGKITADKMDFFVKNLEFGAVATADANVAKYQVPEGQEAYIKMNSTNITFMVAAGDSVDVVVTCSKNSCKNVEDEEVKNRACMVNISGTNYGNEDVTAENGNIIKFGLKAGETDQAFTFQKYSGTGNILISSIEITPVTGTGISSAIVAEEAVDAPAYNLAGQKVDASYKGIVIKGGKKYMNK